MVSIVGKGVLEPYSQALVISEPVRAACLSELMKLPENYRDNVIAVRDNRALSLDELIYDDDEISVFVSVMGG